MLFIFFLFFPTLVLANIMCNDGTMSPSCHDCPQGYCSHHGGCLDGNDIEENNYIYEDYNNFSDDKYISNNKNEYTKDNGNEYLYLIGLGGVSACGYYYGKKKK